MTLPTETDEWVVRSLSGTTFDSLCLQEAVPIQPIGDGEVLLEIKAVSLNYRDLAIATGGYPLPVTFPLVPTSDASAVVLAIGKAVTSLLPGDSVVVLPAPLYDSGHLNSATHKALGGGDLPGTLRRHVILPAAWLARFPPYLSYLEASTLGAAGVTAWNALFGSGSGGAAGGGGPRGIQVGDVVLTQGTGAVALFAAGFAVRAGATVIGTTSESDGPKVRVLRSLGVSEVLNYRVDQAWGETARQLTKHGEGVDLVIDVGGAGSLGQSLKAVRYDGTVAVAGFLSGGEAGPGPAVMEVLIRAINVRGVLAGSRAQYEEMVGKMEEWEFRPVIDGRVFGFGEAREAYRYLWAQKHVGKVVIDFGR